ncbi:MAG: restriction endonuclease subunit S [Eggerthellaceae bacterium]|nr:restriction endonuclease subunit S [Eggerthellaceae bacterium]
MRRANGYLADLLDVQFRQILNETNDDWKRVSLLDIASYKNGLAMQKFRPESPDEGLPVLKIRELGQGYCGTDAERCRSDIDVSVTIRDGDLVFSWSGTLLLEFWAGGDAGLNQHLFKVTSENYPSWFYYMWTKHHLRRFIALAKDRATTMGHIKRSALQESEVLVPPEDTLARLTETMQPIVDEMIGLKIQARNLGEIRDALLPKLMSGEIDISNIESPTQLNSHLYLLLQRFESSVLDIRDLTIDDEDQSVYQNCVRMGSAGFYSAL